jgi:hypothetical protein
MLNKILIKLSPILSKLFNKGINYRLFQTNVLDLSSNILIFIFENRYFYLNRTEKDLLLMLKIILTNLNNIERNEVMKYEIIFYESCSITGNCYNISYPYIIDISYQLYAEELINKIKWSNLAIKNNASEVIVFIYPLY